MSEIVEYKPEEQKTYEEFFARYKQFYAEGNKLPAFMQADAEEVLENNVRDWIQKEGDNLPLYHRTHSGFVKDVMAKKLYPPLFLAVGPFQSAQYSLQRAWTESGMRRVNKLEKVQPVLFEIKIDLRGLEHEVIHPGPNVVAKRDIGIGISQDLNTRKPQLFEIQLVSPKAEERLKAAKIGIVASGKNLTDLLHWSQEHIGHFPLEILL